MKYGTYDHGTIAGDDGSGVEIRIYLELGPGGMVPGVTNGVVNYLVNGIDGGIGVG